MTAVRRYPSYHAPQADRQILCEPSWPDLPGQLVDGRSALNSSMVEILGIPLAEFARDARRALIAQAQHYTNSYADSTIANSMITADESRPLILTGHQPELAHPGVWLKNFAATQLAHQVDGIAVSLIIDSDLCRTPSIRVPTGTVEKPQVVDVPFDQPQQDTPYEERAIVDRTLWNSFGERVTQALAPLVSEPLLAQWWPEVVTSSENTSQLGLAIAQARHRLELSWGSHGLEVPQSQICQTAPFQKFALHLLTDATRLRRDYNDALAEYRQTHRLRSPAQPLPDLSEVEGWIETPFWIWTQKHPARRALFARPGPHGIQLSDRLHWQDTLPVSKDCDPEAALQRLAEWQQQGVKLRSRALITTLYARLVLADTFIHGIGGAKYDQVTDALCLRFFGLLPPAFVTLSGTLRLPIEHGVVSPTRLSELRQRLRELRYHPENYLNQLTIDLANQSQVASWVTQKKRWVETSKTRGNAAERHAQIVAANEALQQCLQPLRKEMEQKFSATVAQTRANLLLESREYPFCLFPRDLLHDFLLDFSRPMP